MLSKISQTEKDKYCMISPYMWNLNKSQTYRNREWSGGCQGLGGEGNREGWVEGTNFQV